MPATIQVDTEALKEYLEAKEVLDNADKRIEKIKAEKEEAKINYLAALSKLPDEIKEALDGKAAGSTTAKLTLGPTEQGKLTKALAEILKTGKANGKKKSEIVKSLPPKTDWNQVTALIWSKPEVYGSEGEKAGKKYYLK